MKSRKESNIPKPFIAMTDMLISLNAGLLVLGILSAIDPRHELDWRRLQQETVRVEQEAAELRRRTLALRQRHQMLVEETKPKPVPAGADEKPDKKHTLALTSQDSTNAN